MNPLFQEWIPTQDPEKWGLDQASIQMVTDYFRFREICDPVKMAVFFWRDINMYRQPYINQLRIEAGNVDFDPLVSRYVESEYKKEVSNIGKTIGNEYEESEGTKNNLLEYLNPEEHQENWDELKGTDVKEKKSFEDRQHDRIQSGTKELKKTGEAAKNFVKDASGSQEELVINRNDGYTETRTGNTKGQTMEQRADTTRQAQKDAPQSAVNIPRSNLSLSNGSSQGDYSANVNAIGNLDFSYASRYGENDSNGATVGKNIEDQSQTITRDGNNGGSETRKFGRNQQTATDLTEKETFIDYKITDKDTGIEKNDKHEDYYGKGNRNINVTHSDQNNSEDFKSNKSGNSVTEKNETERERNTNQLTGREGVTPQEGFESALRYLQNMPLSITWLIGKLEHNFIGIYEL